MSCEKLRGRLDHLAEELPEPSRDEFHAVQASIYLRKSCPEGHTSHTASLLEAQGIRVTPAERRRLKKQEFDYWKGIAVKLLLRHGKIRLI